MPSTHELLILIAAILVLWIVVKVARIAIKMLFLFIAVVVFAGVIWFVFVR